MNKKKLYEIGKNIIIFAQFRINRYYGVNDSFDELETVCVTSEYVGKIIDEFLEDKYYERVTEQCLEYEHSDYISAYIKEIITLTIIYDNRGRRKVSIHTKKY